MLVVAKKCRVAGEILRAKGARAESTTDGTEFTDWEFQISVCSVKSVVGVLGRADAAKVGGV